MKVRDWLGDPRGDRGVLFAEDDGSWTRRNYDELADAAHRVAGALIDDGVRHGDVVAVLMPTGFECLAALFGTWVAGATVCLLVPPAFTANEDYVAHAAAIVIDAAPRLLVTSAGLAPVAGRVLAGAGRDDRPWLWRAGDRAAPREPAELALLQFTSGSSGRARGVRVGWDNLAANIDVIHSWLRWRDGDGTASWLPLHHDMGLIGCLLTTVAGQGDLWLMRPAQFLRDPARWLRCFETAAHTASPPFGFEYAAKRVRPDQLSDVDLTGWRGAIVGAEPIDPAALEAFAGLAGRAGFSSSVYLPAYGLAEATLAVTSDARPGPPTVVRPASSSLRFGAPVGIEAERVLGSPADAASGWLVGCGGPAHGVGVDIVDEAGIPLPQGNLGEVVVSGPSVARGYHAGRTGSSTSFAGGAVRTGDAGFLHRGALYVLGRMGESLKVRGRSVYVEDLESLVVAETGLSRSRCTVVSTGTGVALFVEAPEGPWRADATRALRGALGPEAGIRVIAGGRGLIRRTTSGKPRRRHLWEQLAGSGG
ncbi:AMP-binding protein [Amycolatopsis minnesotensis]|uniref:AMP-dependent synthetase/ligase domain-containing protein n=1 Tax=Amycolatopsis minnesotensis TaxID=337894 RepID=A0ABP5C3T8_9PSEU